MAQGQKPNPIRELPDIGLTDTPLWLQQWCQAVAEQLEGLGRVGDPPAQVTGVTLTQAYPGILIQWNKTLGAARYAVFRSTTGVFATASLVHVLNHIDNISVLNITQDVAVGTALYYWVVAENAASVRGPLSAMGQIDSPSAPPIPSSPAGAIIGISDLDWTFLYIQAERDEWNDTMALVQNSVASNSPDPWMYTEGDDDFWQAALGIR